MMMSSRVSSGFALATLALLVVIDVAAAASVVPFGFFGVAPLVAAMASPPLLTAAVGGLALATAGTVELTLGSEPGSHPSALILVLVLAMISVVISRVRITREASLHQAQHVAETAQRAIVRALPSAVGPVLVASRYVSATKEAQIGGDLYEVSPTPSGLRVIVGDVRGKGLAAVHLAADVLSSFRAWAPLERDATALLKRLNDTVTETADEEEFVTAIVVDVATDGSLTVTNCGHHPPMLVSSHDPEGRFRLLTSVPMSPPLGLFDLGAAPHSEAFRWDVGDRLLMYTDGLVEAPGPTGREYPPDAWAPLLTTEDLEACLDRLVDSVYSHSRNRLEDDLALVLLQNQDGVEALGGADLPREPAGSD